jgi:N-acetylglucosamine kinase-like BadF-type ATPase
MNRKALANETDKVLVDISFRARKSVAETGAFAPVVEACYDAGHVLAESIALCGTVSDWMLCFGSIGLMVLCTWQP